MVEAAFARTHDVVDLSVPIASGLPCTWPGHTAFSSVRGADFSTGQPYRTATITMDEHAGTHVDAPCHSIPPPASGSGAVDTAAERTVAVIPLSDLMGPAVVIDVPQGEASGEPGCSPRVSVAALQAFEVAHGPVRERDIVLLRTGWDRRYGPMPHGRAYIDEPLSGMAGWPAPDEAFLEFLLHRGVRCIGTDAPSIGALDDPGAAHVHTLRNGIWPVEALANLTALPNRGAFFLFLPLAIEGSGAPGRAIAFVPREASS